jgi:hypothetical protein
MSRQLKRGVLGLVELAALTASALLIPCKLTKLPGKEKTPSAVRRYTALHIEMRDGVPIAAEVWLPQDYQDWSSEGGVSCGTAVWVP